MGTSQSRDLGPTPSVLQGEKAGVRRGASWEKKDVI